MQEAYNRLQHENSATANLPDILEYLAYSMYQQGNIEKALELTKELFQMNPLHPRAEGNVKYYENMLAEAPVAKKNEAQIVNRRKDDNTIPERDVYEALCRGEYELVKKNMIFQ